MENLIGAAVLVVLVGGAAAYLIRAKRSGVKCVGCPAGGACHNSQKVKRKKLKGSVIARKTMMISGMHCARCVQSVSENLNRIEGVSAQADLEKGCARLAFDREVEENVLIQAVEKAGFTVTSIQG